ncbi:MAG: hypothetical protein MJ048_03035 [Acidaminococcaceae bacterium]|nr:hypothetical protein [Acidaminococcaceae bacterium]
MRKSIFSTLLLVIFLSWSNLGFALDSPDENGWMYSHTIKNDDGTNEDFYMHSDYLNEDNDPNIVAVWTCAKGAKEDKYMMLAFYLNEKMYTLVKSVSMDGNGNVTDIQVNKDYAKTASEIESGSTVEAMYNLIKGAK